MGAILFNNKLYPTGGTPSASMNVYDNSDSGLDATNVQDAIDELAEGGGGGGGHVIIDDTGTAVAQRLKLQFGDYDLTDDETDDVTKVNLVKPEEITWVNYQQLTPAQKAGKQFYVPDYPSIGGVFFFQTEAAMQAAEATLPDNAVCIVWEDDPYTVTANIVEYDNTSSELEADNVQDAVDEVVEAIDDICTIKEGTYTDASSFTASRKIVKRCNNFAQLYVELPVLSQDVPLAWTKIGAVSPKPLIDTVIPLFNGIDTKCLGYAFFNTNGDLYLHGLTAVTGVCPVIMGVYLTAY